MHHDSSRRTTTLIAMVCALAALLAGCSSTSNNNDEATTVATEVVHTDGNPDVWWRIENGTSCPDLAAEYDTALDNAEARPPGDRLRTLSLDYAQAARERMTELGCPGF